MESVIKNLIIDSRGSAYDDVEYPSYPTMLLNVVSFGDRVSRMMKTLFGGMTMEHSHDDNDWMTVPTFETELAQLIDKARHDDAPIKGTYDMRTPYPDKPDYTIEITEVTKQRFPPTDRT